MNHLTQYYKNLCENLEEQLFVLNEKYKKALRVGTPEALEKEIFRQKHKQDTKQEQGEILWKAGTEAEERLKKEPKFDQATYNSVVGGLSLAAMAEKEKSQEHGKNVKKLKAAKAKALGEQLFSFEYLKKYLLEDEEPNALDPKEVEKQTKKQKPVNLKVERLNQEVDQIADQGHL
jgi:hypothetical protein